MEVFCSFEKLKKNVWLYSFANETFFGKFQLYVHQRFQPNNRVEKRIERTKIEKDGMNVSFPFRMDGKALQSFAPFLD